MKLKPYLTGRVYYKNTNKTKSGQGTKLKLISFIKCPHRKKDCMGNNCPGKLLFKNKKTAICGYWAGGIPKYKMYKTFGTISF